eukprot:1895917-Amphidinium_carterae.1
MPLRWPATLGLILRSLRLSFRSYFGNPAIAMNKDPCGSRDSSQEAPRSEGYETPKVMIVADVLTQTP